MGKIYNVRLNSINATKTITTNSNVIYNIDWANLLPRNKKFKVTFAFMSALNYGNSFSFPYITTNILGNTYKPAINGFQNAYYLGHIKPLQSITNYCYYQSQINDNPPVYLDCLPMNKDLQVRVLTSTTDLDFVDNYYSIPGSGTLTQSGFIVTIVTSTAGLITLGTVLTVAAVNRTITQFITGNGGVGTYLCNLSATVTPATAYTFPEDTIPNAISPYILNLSFEEVDEDD